VIPERIIFVSRGITVYIHIYKHTHYTFTLPIPVVAPSKAWVCGRLLAGIMGPNLAGEHGCLSLVSAMREEEVSATGRSLVQRSPTECGVSVCDPEASIMKRPWPTRGSRTIKNKTLK